ncbi:hypothetical protein ACFW5I_10460 [Streptomyces sp. NPDC058818]|uniref:hypothetical protein n=1 Tax=Streptomyces sp. NPDC058818 TaxID=3346640 RepID=UPI0036C09083
MAERVTPADVTFRRRGAPRRYPWDDWMDGSMWHLKRGVDYQTTTKVFRDIVYNAARRGGRTVHTRVIDNGIVITFPKGEKAEQGSIHIRYFLAGTDPRRVISFTQNEIDELPTRIYGLTEMQLLPVVQDAA